MQNQRAGDYWIDICGGHHNEPAVLAEIAKLAHSGNKVCGQHFFSRMAHAHIQKMFC
jgi:hypothetical protein